MKCEHPNMVIDAVLREYKSMNEYRERHFNRCVKCGYTVTEFKEWQKEALERPNNDNK